MALFAEPFNPLVVLFIAALALITWILLFRTHRYFAAQRTARPRLGEPVRAGRRPAAHAAEAPDAAGWEVKMHDTARELSAQLNSKMGALEALIADADRAAARLEAALGQAVASGATPPARSASSSPPASQADALRQPRREELPARTDREEPPPDRTAHAQRREEVYTLADYGFDAAEIARRTGIPIGEVELILRLRGR